MTGLKARPAFLSKLRRLVLVPILSVALTVVVLPADANAPNVQGVSASDGTASPALPGSALDAPQYGRPAGTGGGRRN
jgi:hypothetical protein